MATTFEYTFRKIDLTVEVVFDYGLIYNYTHHGGEPFVGSIEINSVKCGELDLTTLFDHGAYNKFQMELEDACCEYASRD